VAHGHRRSIAQTASSARSTGRLSRRLARLAPGKPVIRNNSVRRKLEGGSSSDLGLITSMKTLREWKRCLFLPFCAAKTAKRWATLMATPRSTRGTLTRMAAPVAERERPVPHRQASRPGARCAWVLQGRRDCLYGGIHRRLRPDGQKSSQRTTPCAPAVHRFPHAGPLGRRVIR
jgi:hypothetical protein